MYLYIIYIIYTRTRTGHTRNTHIHIYTKKEIIINIAKIIYRKSIKSNKFYRRPGKSVVSRDV